MGTEDVQRWHAGARKRVDTRACITEQLDLGLPKARSLLIVFDFARVNLLVMQATRTSAAPWGGTWVYWRPETRPALASCRPSLKAICAARGAAYGYTV